MHLSGLRTGRIPNLGLRADLCSGVVPGALDLDGGRNDLNLLKLTPCVMKYYKNRPLKFPCHIDKI